MAFKMKGHSLPGINQRSKSPAKHPHLSKANHSLRSHVDNFKRGFSDQASKPIKENLPFVGKSPSKQLVEPDPTQFPDPTASDATSVYIDPLDQLSEEEREEIMSKGESDARLKNKAEANTEASDEHINEGSHADHHMMFSMGDWIHSPNDKIRMEREEAVGLGHEHHHISPEESGRLDEIEEQRQTGNPLQMKSPLQQGVLTCPECGMQIEDSEGGGEAMMQHIMDDHFGGSTGGGTPGYINIHNPGGWEPGDPVGPAATKEDKTPRLNTPN